MEIQALNISKKFNDFIVFKNLNFSINSGEMVAIVGESGSGKTTLLNCLGQLENVSSGQLLIDKKKITKQNRRKFFKEDAGFLP
jgi:putative ABC transport system ATP-binding protein